MTPRQAQRLVVTGALGATTLIAWGWIKQGEAPPPSAFVYVAGLYGLLALGADMGAPELAAALTAGITVGILFRVIQTTRRQPSIQPVGGRRPSQPQRRPVAVQRRTVGRR